MSGARRRPGRCPGRRACIAGGQVGSLLLDLLDGVDRLAERGAGSQVEGDGGRRELAQVADEDRRSGGRCQRGERAQRHLARRWSSGRRYRPVVGVGLESGSTSRMTWYWLSWVKMVEIWRWPKAS